MTAALAMDSQRVETATSVWQFSDEERLVLRPRDNITVSQWAQANRIVVSGGFRGPWRNDLTPYLVKPMDTFNSPWVRKILICAAPQWGKTNFAINCLCYAIDQAPGPALYIMAGEKSAVRISNRQIGPTLRATPRIAALMTGVASDDTTYFKRFRNGMELMLGWASSPEILGSESCRYVLFDEPGKYPDFAGREADPFSLGEVRATAYPHNSKLLYYTTPNMDGDAWDRHFTAVPDERWELHARCPVCGHLQRMRFRDISWPTSASAGEVVRAKLARYQCQNCPMEWDDHMRNRAILAGEWVCDSPVERPAAVGFGPCPSWTSPFVSLSKAAEAYLRAKQDHTKIIAFVTQHKAQSYKETLTTGDQSRLLALRSELPSGVVPVEAVALTCGIDAQNVNFYFAVRAWAPDLTSWLVQYGTLSDWEHVAALIFESRWAKASGERYGIWRAAIDTGGGEAQGGDWSRTEEIYQFIRARGAGVVHGVKGASRPQLKRVKTSVIDKMARGNRPIPGGLELHMLDVDQFKRLLHWRMARSVGEAQRAHLPRDVGGDYIEHITAEELRRDRRGNMYWHQVRRANHWLDCEVYAAACADGEWTPSLVHLARAQELCADESGDGDVAIGDGQAEHLSSRSARARPGWFSVRR